jgi:hypothetical protein
MALFRTGLPALRAAAAGMSVTKPFESFQSYFWRAGLSTFSRADFVK